MGGCSQTSHPTSTALDDGDATTSADSRTARAARTQAGTAIAAFSRPQEPTLQRGQVARRKSTPISSVPAPAGIRPHSPTR